MGVFEISLKNCKCFAYFYIHFLCTCNLANYLTFTNAFYITVFYTVIIKVILARVFIVLTAVFLNMFIKLSYMRHIFQLSFVLVFCVFFWFLVLGYYSIVFAYFMFGCFLFLVFALLLCVFVNVLHVFCLLTIFNNYNSSASSTFFHIHDNVDKNFLKTLWLLFSALFLAVWKFGSIKVVTYR